MVDLIIEELYFLHIRNVKPLHWWKCYFKLFRQLKLKFSNNILNFVVRKGILKKILMLLFSKSNTWN